MGLAFGPSSKCAARRAETNLGTARQGAAPLMSGGEMVAAFAVSGAPGGDKGEACIQAALAKSPVR